MQSGIVCFHISVYVNLQVFIQTAFHCSGKTTLMVIMQMLFQIMQSGFMCFSYLCVFGNLFSISKFGCLLKHFY
jgi:hypothetical protein